MDAKLLQQELQALQRGRGVARPHVRTWAGPLLRELVGDVPEHGDHALRESLTAFLVDASLALPTDLCYVFLMASGVESDEPLLRQRLAEAGRVIQRDPRTLSRYLRRAEALLVELLLKSDDEETHPYDTGGWATTRLALDIRLDRPRPLAYITQVIRATREDQTEFRHTVAVTFPTPPDQTPSVTAVAACRLQAVEPLSDRSWVAIMAVPPVARGRSHRLEFKVEFPDRRHLMPFAAFAPIRACASLDVRVDFGNPPFTTSIWRVNAVPPPLVTDRPTGRPNLALDGGIAAAAFTHLRPGYAYGLAWSETS